MSPSGRPLSPHLQVYRFTYTMATSIAHRATGIVLSAGVLLLAAWLLALASGPDAYDTTVGVLLSPPGLVVLLGVIVAFWYHTFAGVRHLVFDTGTGLGKAAARRSAALLAAATLAASLASAWLLFAREALP